MQNKFRYLKNNGLLLFLILISIFVIVPRAFGEYKNGREGIVVGSVKYTPLPQNKESKLGQNVFEQNHCAECHSIKGQGGCLAPPLDGIGANRSPEFILLRIKRGETAEAQFAELYGRTQLMPHVRISAREAKLVTRYLLTLAPPSNGFFVTKHEIGKTTAPKVENKQREIENEAKIIATGRELVYKNGCTACHSIHGIGGHFAPPLDGISERHDENYIRDHITNVEFFMQNGDSEYGNRGTVMPPCNLSTNDIEKICKFLMTCK